MGHREHAQLAGSPRHEPREHALGDLGRNRRHVGEVGCLPRLLGVTGEVAGHPEPRGGTQGGERDVDH